MIPTLYWVTGPWPGRLAITARPRGRDWLEEEVSGWRAAGIDIIVSLLTQEEERELEITAEGALVTGCGMRFLSFPVEDRSVPASAEETGKLVAELHEELRAGKSVAVHCRQGIGRSALIAAGTLVASGVEPPAALEIVAAARGLPVPETPKQRNWFERELAALVKSPAVAKP